jgi:hypothetical protein
MIYITSSLGPGYISVLQDIFIATIQIQLSCSNILSLINKQTATLYSLYTVNTEASS